MGKRIIFFFYYFFFWLLYFVIARILFLFYHFADASEQSWFSWLQSMYYGLSMDVSAAAALCIIPAITLLFTTHIRGGKISSIVINIYTCILLLVIVCLNVIDMELYQAGGSRIFTSFQKVIDTGAVSSLFSELEMNHWLKNSLFFILTCVVFIAYYFESVGSIIAYFKKANILTIILLLCFTAGLYFPLVFGIKVVDIKQVPNHSEVQFLNDATHNPIWETGKKILKTVISE